MKLSTLELHTLNKVEKKLNNLVTTYIDNKDSVQDFLYEQFVITTDEPETLKIVRECISDLLMNLEKAHNEFTMLTEHLKEE